MVFKLDSPPATDNVVVLRDYINDLYESIAMVIHNIDSDNMTEDFLNTLQTRESEGV